MPVISNIVRPAAVLALAGATTMKHTAHSGRDSMSSKLPTTATKLLGTASYPVAQHDTRTLHAEDKKFAGLAIKYGAKTDTLSSSSSSVAGTPKSNDDDFHDAGMELAAKGGGGSFGGAGCYDDDDCDNVSACFSLKSSSVEILNAENKVTKIPLKDLKEGDTVVLGKKDGILETQKFSGEYYHRKQDVAFDFVTIKAGNESLSLTDNHYIVTADDDGMFKLKMAGELRVGDTVIHEGKPVEISEIQADTEFQGAASPVIPQGTLQVNGFNVSTYSGDITSGTPNPVVGYNLASAITDSFAALTRAVYTNDALKPDEHGTVEMVGQNMYDAYKSRRS